MFRPSFPRMIVTTVLSGSLLAGAAVAATAALRSPVASTTPPVVSVQMAREASALNRSATPSAHTVISSAGDPHEQISVHVPTGPATPRSTWPGRIIPPPLPGPSITVTSVHNPPASFPQPGVTYRLLPEMNLSLEQLGTLAGQGTLHLNPPSADRHCAALNGAAINIFVWKGEYFAHNGLEGSQRVYCTWELERVAGWPIPAITSVTNNPAAPGATVVIRGRNFAAAPPASSIALVHYSATTDGPVLTPAITSWSNTQVSLTLPATAPAGDYEAVLFQGAASGYVATAPFRVVVPVRYRYTCDWQGGLVLLNHVPNVTVESLPDAQVAGQCADFRTNDPYYRALNGRSLNVFTAAAEFPGQYAVHNGLQGPQPVYGTWTFAQFYDCRFNGHLEYLHHVTNVTIEDLPDARLAGQCTDFLTNDLYYRALNGRTLNVFTAPREFPGQYAVHNGLQGPQPVYGTWTFPEVVPLSN